MDLLLVRLTLACYVVDSFSGRRAEKRVSSAYSALIAQRFAQRRIQICDFLSRLLKPPDQYPKSFLFLSSFAR